MKKLIAAFTISLMMITFQNGFAQTEPIQGRVTNVFKFNLLMPGFSYEQKLGLMTTLHFETYMDALVVAPTFENSGYTFHPTPSFKTELRTYYNILDRYKKGKYSAHNSGNYFSLFYQGRFSQTGDYTGNQLVNQAGILWGFQRNFPSGLSFDFNFGIVNSFVSSDIQYYNRIQPATNLRLGYRFGGKSKK
jgi:hypothetical protein